MQDAFTEIKCVESMMVMVAFNRVAQNLMMMIRCAYPCHRDQTNTPRCRAMAIMYERHALPHTQREMTRELG